MVDNAISKPHILMPGDRVRLLAPTSPFDQNDFQRGKKVLYSAGFIPLVDKKEFQRCGFLAGCDSERAERVQNAFDENESQAIWCIRGGYGTARILPLLDLDRIRSSAKLVIGFSDITALLNFLCFQGKMVCVHGPNVTQLAYLPSSVLHWLLMLTRRFSRMPTHVPLGRMHTVVRGKAEGTLMGGNLTVLASLAGTLCEPSFKNAILLLEDVGEKAYRLDRAFYQLHQSGILKGVRGVVLGKLVECSPRGRGYYSAERVLERALIDLGVPCIAGANFGHLNRNIALPIGVCARLDAERPSLTLLEHAVC